jgi:hypothetical protein
MGQQVVVKTGKVWLGLGMQLPQVKNMEVSYVRVSSGLKTSLCSVQQRAHSVHDFIWAQHVQRCKETACQGMFILVEV